MNDVQRPLTLINRPRRQPTPFQYQAAFRRSSLAARTSGTLQIRTRHGERLLISAQHGSLFLKIFMLVPNSRRRVSARLTTIPPARAELTTICVLLQAVIVLKPEAAVHGVATLALFSFSQCGPCGAPANGGSERRSDERGRRHRPATITFNRHADNDGCWPEQLGDGACAWGMVRLWRPQPRTRLGPAAAVAKRADALQFQTRSGHRILASPHFAFANKPRPYRGKPATEFGPTPM